MMEIGKMMGEIGEKSGKFCENTGKTDFEHPFEQYPRYASEQKHPSSRSSNDFLTKSLKRVWRAINRDKNLLFYPHTLSSLS